MDKDKEIIGISGIAKHLGLSERTVWRMSREGKVPAPIGFIKTGNCVSAVYSKESIDAMRVHVRGVGRPIVTKIVRPPDKNCHSSET